MESKVLSCKLMYKRYLTSLTDGSTTKNATTRGQKLWEIVKTVPTRQGAFGLTAGRWLWYDEPTTEEKTIYVHDIVTDQRVSTLTWLSGQASSLMHFEFPQKLNGESAALVWSSQVVNSRLQLRMYNGAGTKAFALHFFLFDISISPSLPGASYELPDDLLNVTQYGNGRIEYTKHCLGATVMKCFFENDQLFVFDWGSNRRIHIDPSTGTSLYGVCIQRIFLGGKDYYIVWVESASTNNSPSPQVKPNTSASPLLCY